MKGFSGHGLKSFPPQEGAFPDNKFIGIVDENGHFNDLPISKFVKGFTKDEVNQRFIV